MDTDSELAPPPAPPTARLPRPLAPSAGPLPHVQTTSGVPGALRAFNRFSVGGQVPAVEEAAPVSPTAPTAKAATAPPPAAPPAPVSVPVPSPGTADRPSPDNAPVAPVPPPQLRRPAAPPPPSAAPRAVPAPARPAQPPVRPPVVLAPPAGDPGPAPAAAPAEPAVAEPTSPSATVAEPATPVTAAPAAPVTAAPSVPEGATVAEPATPPTTERVAPPAPEAAPPATPVTAAPSVRERATVAEPATPPASEPAMAPPPKPAAPAAPAPPAPTATPVTTGVRSWLVAIARPRTWRDAVPALIGAVVIAAAVAGIAALPGRGVGSTTLPAANSVAGLVASARDRAAAGDPAGAARDLLARAATASPDERGILREQAARILVEAATAAAGAGHPSESLDLDRAAAALADTPTGAVARAGLPDAILAAARGLIQSGDASTAAQGLLNELVAGYPSTPAGVEAGALLRDPTPVRGALTVGGRPSAATTVYLFATTGGSDPQPSLATPVAAATTGPDGHFDLGTLAPGTYLFAWRTPGGVLRRAAGADALAVVTPARVNVLDETFAS